MSEKTTVDQQKAIAIEELDLKDQRFQVRKATDPVRIEEYAQLVQDSGAADLSAFASPPILWKRKDGKYIICDGWHRIHAGIKAGVNKFRARVLEDDEASATIQAMKANLKHGLSLKPEEKLQACLRTIQALETQAGAQPSSQVVADALGISEGSVRGYRKQLEESGQLKPAETVVGKDGKKQAAKKPSKCSTARRNASANTPFAEPAPKPVMPCRIPSASKLTFKEMADQLKGMNSCPAPTAPGVEAADLSVLRNAVQILRSLRADVLKMDGDESELSSVLADIVEAAVAALELLHGPPTTAAA